MERQCARPVRRWSICLNGQRHRPAAHNGRVGCQGHKSISRKRSKVARCIEARETAARRGFRSSRALSSYTSPAILRDWTPGEKYGSHLDKFSKENDISSRFWQEPRFALDVAWGTTSQLIQFYKSKSNVMYSSPNNLLLCVKIFTSEPR